MVFYSMYGLGIEFQYLPMRQVRGMYCNSIITLDWFLGAMLVLGPPPKGFMCVIMIQYFMNYSIGKECYVFISFNIRPYNGKLQSLVTPLPFRDFWWN